MSEQTGRLAKNQSAFDLALQRFGSVEGLAQMHWQSNGSRLFANTDPGVYVVEDPAPIRAEIVLFFQSKTIISK